MPKKSHRRHKKSPSPPPSPQKALQRKNLKNIIEVSEQHDTYRIQDQIHQNVSLTRNTTLNKNILVRSCSCFKALFKAFQSSPNISMTVKENQLIQTIKRLREQKIIRSPVLPPLKEPAKTLVLDFDGTLLHSSFNEPKTYDFSCMIPLKNSSIKVYTEMRFGVESFLFEMSKIYEIVIYTVRKQPYANKMLSLIDKKHWVSHLLDQSKCITLNKIHHLKSIGFLGRDPNDVVFLDSNPVSGLLQPDNFCQIKCFSGEKNDHQLIKIIPFLKQLAQKKSVKPLYKHYEQFHNRQIQLQFLNLQLQNDKQDKDETPKNRKPLNPINFNDQYHIEQKKKKYGHKKTNSEVESLSKNNEQKQTEDNTTVDHQQSAYQLRTKYINQM